MRYFLFLAIFGWAVLGCDVALAAPSMAISQEKCLNCHADAIDAEAFAGSVHGSNACTSCHVDVTDLDRHLSGTVPALPVDCSRCHKEATAKSASSVHFLNDITCSGCHSRIHEAPAWDGGKRRVVETCHQCHETAHYKDSVHWTAIRQGNSDSAACHDCHNLHRIEAIDQGSIETKAFHTRVCLRCHADEAMMKRNGVFPVAEKTYYESYHGQSYQLGFPVAGCADCHTAHHVLPEKAPSSSIHPRRILATCGQCHSGITASFTKYHVHGDHTDRASFPVMWWTYVLMTALVVGVFAVFWVHTLLWLFRGMVEKQKEKFGMAEPPPAGKKLRRYYRRFTPTHVFLHLTVIFSFLGLSVTGLPLKFSEHEWAQTMMSFYGGVYYAGLIHRACAILTFYYFVSALVMSFDFLFVRKDKLTRRGEKANWLQRLFGPESLMPNLRDVRDIRDMFRWFVFRGPKPTFERWTYWEKFDFLAVFWGMFAIGGSGLLLWFPEFFTRFLPGWILNVAHIIHSDEALLATGFIFTVHFFNTHGRPEKFPMDFVIFNGELSEEEFREEREDQWRRYEEAGVIEDLAVEKPSGVLFDFFFKGFGILALLTGLGLAFLMFLAFVKA